jgi:epsilon-lactone hydrolase
MARMTRREFQAGTLGTATLGLAGPASGLIGETAMAEEMTGLKVPAHVLPVPKSISPQAQAFLSGAAKRIAAMGAAPPSGDQREAAERALQMLRPRAAGFKGKLETIVLGPDAKLYRVTPDGRIGRHAKVAYFDIHGGGFTAGGGEMCQVLATLRAMEYGVEVWSVDYRLAPQHAYPAALDDCMAAWREVLKHRKAADIVAAGASAGGNLVAAMLLRARDEGLPLPAALLMLTPGVDMTGAGDTRVTNRWHDVNLYGGGGDGPSAYTGTADAKHPYLSPVYGDFHKGWVPTLLSSGTRDLLLSDTVRMHRALRRAGVRAELHITEAGCHGGFMGTAPEDMELMGECKRFCNAAWKI